MLAISDEGQHVVSHLDELVLREGLLLLSLAEGFCDLGLPEIRFDRVDHLNTFSNNYPELTLNKKALLMSFSPFWGGFGKYYLSSSSAMAAL